MELLLTATLIDATTAAQRGLVNRGLPTEGLMPWALATAATIATNSPIAVQAVKQQISTTLVEQALAREALDQALGDRVRASPHYTEGVTAFRHKRQPHYS
jgi:enoyl-CoA hydratase/carnithine racemase